MKKTMILMLTVIALLSCHYQASSPIIIKTVDSSLLHIKEDTPVYHIRVQCFNGDGDYYSIKFTNDNWNTSDDIMQTFDISMDGVYSNDVCYQLLLTPEPNAINIAKEFKTYEQCIISNLAVKKEYGELVRYRNAHPCSSPKTPVSTPEPCCEVKQIY